MKKSLKTRLKIIAYDSFVTPLYILLMMCRDSNLNVFKFLMAKQRNYVFMIAMHNNGGDLAQTVCIDEWIYKNYPNGVVVNVAWTSPHDKILKSICKGIRKQDNVFVHSGFNITDICDEFASPTVFPSHKIILELLQDHKIVFFPQSVEYKSLEKWEPIKEMYAKHKNIVFISRDKISQQYAKKLIPNAKHLAYPDIVTTWIGKFQFEQPTKDIFLCLRTGAESLLNENNKEEILKRLSDIGTIGIGDTDVCASPYEYRGHRKRVVLDKIKEFARYRVVVTDRYHGVIFSLIAGRPVVIIKTAGHKVESAIDWFPESFKSYIYFVKDPKDIDTIVSQTKTFLNKANNSKLSDYFDKEVYEKLYKEINE